ncbi:MAG: hypothetical protein MZV64_00270 [Ignavibacteriales bacterium]|nr:hypothetical protein [Ignavibacteriales bacterium]
MKTSVTGTRRRVCSSVDSRSGLDESDFGVAVKRLSILQKRRGDLDEAVRLWEESGEARSSVCAHRTGETLRAQTPRREVRHEMDKVRLEAWWRRLTCPPTCASTGWTRSSIEWSD